MQETNLTIDDIDRIYWHSRRGMLELDLVLMPFAKQDYAGLSLADKQRYVDLLSSEDQDMFAWFMGHKKPADRELQAIVQLILDRHAKRPAKN